MLVNARRHSAGGMLHPAAKNLETACQQQRRLAISGVCAMAF